jgi:hypothetical protein
MKIHHSVNHFGSFISALGALLLSPRSVPGRYQPSLLSFLLARSDLHLSFVARALEIATHFLPAALHSSQQRQKPMKGAISVRQNLVQDPESEGSLHLFLTLS